MSEIISKAQQENAVIKFEADLHNLMEVLDKSEPIKIGEGGSVKVWASKAPSTVSYTEGSEIPNCDTTPTGGTDKVLTWKPYRSVATYQKIQTQGFDTCVGGSADSLRKQIGADFRTALCTAIKTGTTTATGAATVQQCAANAIAKVMDKTADEAGTYALFMSPMTWAKYAGVANITTQTAFGMEYVRGFLGAAVCIILPGLQDDEVYATTLENITFVCADVAAISEKMSVDETGVFGISIEDRPAVHGYDIVVSGGMNAFLAVLDRCAICSLSAS